MQHDAAHDLHPVRAHAEHTVSRLAADGERLRQKRVKRLTGGVTLLKFLRLCAKLLVGQLFIRLLERHDGLDLRLELFDLALGAGAEQFRKQSHGKNPFCAAAGGPQRFSRILK